MAFEELEQRLPNGFHDAATRETTLDKDCRTICRVLAFNHLSQQTAPTLIGSRHAGLTARMKPQVKRRRATSG